MCRSFCSWDLALQYSKHYRMGHKSTWMLLEILILYQLCLGSMDVGTLLPIGFFGSERDKHQMGGPKFRKDFYRIPFRLLLSPLAQILTHLHHLSTLFFAIYHKVYKVGLWRKRTSFGMRTVESLGSVKYSRFGPFCGQMCLLWFEKLRQLLTFI